MLSYATKNETLYETLLQIAIKTYCKISRVRSNGKAPLYYVVRHPKVKNPLLISAHKSLEPRFFDNKTGKVKKGLGNSTNLNSYLSRKVQEIENLAIEMEKELGVVNLKELKKRYEAKSSLGFGDFFDFSFDYLGKEKARLSPATVKDYEGCLNRLKNYAPSLTLNQITPNFLEEYEIYLSSYKGRERSGFYHELATIRKFTTVAFRNGLIKSNPFSYYSIPVPKKNTVKSYLTPQELLKLYHNYFSGSFREPVKRTLYYYLLSCFTGLRFKDVYEISQRQQELSEKFLNDDMVTWATSKSRYKKKAEIPLNEYLRKLLKNPANRPLKQSNSRVNNDLREALEIAGIDKYATFHSARHTFAVTCKYLGMDTMTVRDLLTQESEKTTEIYAKIADDLKKKEMRVWDKLENI